MKIEMLNTEQDLWNKTILFAEKCSWAPGRRLAERMKINDFRDWERVFAAVRDGEVVGFCVFEHKGTVPKEFDFHPFLNMVFVDEGSRGQHISQMLVESALRYAKELGYSRVYLKSEHRGLYEKYGFRKIADFVPVTGKANQLFETDL